MPIIYWNDTSGHSYLFCNHCGKRIRCCRARLSKHGCYPTWKALRLGDLVPEGIYTQYTNLWEHLAQGEQLIEKFGRTKPIADACKGSGREFSSFAGEEHHGPLPTRRVKDPRPSASAASEQEMIAS